MEFGKEYLTVVQERFVQVKELGDKTIAQLTQEETHWKLNEASNSIAIIMKHMSGNMISRWTDFLTTDGEKSTRNRDAEFTEEKISKEVLLTLWEKGWQTLLQTIEGLTNDDLLKTVTIRGEKHTVIEAIERQVAHYAYHVGQIVYIGKQIKDEQWDTLSIAKGQSESYLQKQLKKHRS